MAPLGFAGTHVLINDGLGTVGKVAKLCLPGHHGIRVAHRVAVFKSHAGVFGECGVVHQELARALGAGQRVEGVVFLGVAGINEHGVTLGEGASTGIFTRQAH